MNYISILLHGVIERERQREILITPKLRTYYITLKKTRLKKTNIYLKLCPGKHVD